MKFNITSRSKIHLITTALMLGLSIQAPAVAGNHRTNKSNEFYHSISEIPENIFKRNGKQHDASMAISPDTVLYKFKQKQKITLVDVRNSQDFERMHIPGSLNIPLHAVKTKVFFKSFPVVLINEGFHYSPLVSECRKLKDIGFKAYILDGGLLTWNRKGSRLVGDLFALEDMKTVTPRVFLREKDYKNTLVIDISPVQTELSKQLMPFSAHIPVSADPGEWFRKLDRIITSHKDYPFLSVVVFNKTGEGYGSVNNILAGAGANAFYLQGGVGGYNRYLEDLMLSWRPWDNRIKTNRKCGICVEEIEEDIITKVRK
jgi:rhodanese-related sulfurtransferase